MFKINEQEISGCDRTTHWDLLQNQGRGATEIDIMEAMPGKQVVKEDEGDLGVGLPYMSTTLQISPGVARNRPIPGKNFTELGVRLCAYAFYLFVFLYSPFLSSFIPTVME